MSDILKADKHPVVLKYFLLPLYDICSKIVEDSFLNAYVNKDNSMLFLELKEDNYFDSNNLYQGKCTINNRIFHLFSTNTSLSLDIEKILKGKYSQVSKLAKSKIVKLSGLPYMESRSDGIYTAYPLMALFKFPEWKTIMEDFIKNTIPEDSELLSTLDKKRIFIEDITEV